MESSNFLLDSEKSPVGFLLKNGRMDIYKLKSTVELT